MRDDGSNGAKSNVVNSIVDFVRERFPAAPVVLTAETALLDGGIIDSLGVIDLMAFLEAEHGIEIDDADYAMENFETIASLAQLVEQKRLQ
jgi:acyl carrier protein